MRSTRKVAGACLIGVFAAFAGISPATAATKPTLEQPPTPLGYSDVTLTGTAEPGATVQLFESAFKWHDYYPAPIWGTDTYVTAKANAAGRFTLVRKVDSGFWFKVAVDGVESNEISVPIKVLPTLTLAVTGNSVKADVLASPGQPWLPVEIQQASGSNWTKVASGYTSEVKGEVGRYSTTLTGLADGNYSFRAAIGGEAENAVLANESAAQAVTIGTPKPTTPPTTKPTPTPTKPTPKPTPKPTTPPAPKAGSVLFTKIQYNSPGTDTGTNGSLNAEWVVLTNKTKASINLRNWTVRDKAGHVFKFGSNWYLAAGKSLYIRTGTGKNVTTNVYWQRKGKGGYVWNNTGDTAYLRSYTGATIDTCTWGNGKGTTNC